MKRIIFCLACLLLGAGQAQSQGFDSLYAFHPDTNFWRNINVIENVLPYDNQIIITGRTLRDTLNFNGSEQVCYIAAIDYLGTKIWQKRLSYNAPNYESNMRFYRPLPLAKISGHKMATFAIGTNFTQSAYIKLYPFFVIFSDVGDTIRKIDIQFNSLYDKKPYFIESDKQHNLLIGGEQWNDVGTHPLDSALMFINKYDSSGNLKWNRLYYGLGGPERGILPEKLVKANGNSSDYLLVGKSGITDSMAAARQSMMMVARMDSAGNLLWMKTLPKMRDYFVQGVSSYFEDLIPAQNGSGYYFLGYESMADTSSMPSYYVAKLDEQGSLLWARQYIIPGVGSYAETFNINQKRNGDLILSANVTRAQPYYRKSPYLLCIDSCGNVKWGKEYRRNLCDPYLTQFVMDTKLGPNDKIIMGGVVADGSYTPSACFPYNYAMARLIVTDSMGRVDPTDTIYDTTQIQVVTFPLKLRSVPLPTARLVVFPNPATHELNVLLANLQPAANDELQVMDIQGRALLRKRMDGGRALVDVSALVPGTYLVRLFRQGSLQATAKFVKQ